MSWKYRPDRLFGNEKKSEHSKMLQMHKRKKINKKKRTNKNKNKTH